MSDPNGVEDISWAQIIVHESRSVANSCYLHYAPQGNRLFLRNDDGSAWLTSLVVGSPGVLQNSQCQVDLGNSAVSSAGPTRTLDLDIEFLQAGTKEHSLWLRDLSGETSGWPSWVAGRQLTHACRCEPCESPVSLLAELPPHISPGTAWSDSSRAPVGCVTFPRNQSYVSRIPVQDRFEAANRVPPPSTHRVVFAACHSAWNGRTQSVLRVRTTCWTSRAKSAIVRSLPQPIFRISSAS